MPDSSNATPVYLSRIVAGWTHLVVEEAVAIRRPLPGSRVPGARPCAPVPAHAHTGLIVLAAPVEGLTVLGRVPSIEVRLAPVRRGLFPVLGRAGQQVPPPHRVGRPDGRRETPVRAATRSCAVAIWWCTRREGVAASPPCPEHGRSQHRPLHPHPVAGEIVSDFIITPWARASGCGRASAARAALAPRRRPSPASDSECVPPHHDRCSALRGRPLARGSGAAQGTADACQRRAKCYPLAAGGFLARGYF